MQNRTQPTELRTQRLILRQWQEKDRLPFAEINADPEVMEHYPACLNKTESDTLMDRISNHIAENGWGLWALEIIDTHEFIGYTGLNIVTYETHFTPAIEIGWRLAKSYWGKGFAFEAATAAMNYAFEVLKLEEVVSFTIPKNQRSERLMQRLGMRRDIAGNFDHPNLPENHPMRPHILYRLSNPQFAK